MIIDILTDAIRDNIGPLKPAPKNWGKRCCMLCHTQGHGKDTRFRFGIQFSPTSIRVNCFNCGFSSGYTEGKELSKSFKFFLTQIDIDQKFIEHIGFEIFKQKHSIHAVREGDEQKVVIDKIRSLFDKWHTKPLPETALPIKTWLEEGLDDPNFLRVVDYILSRKIFNLDEFYWTPDTNFNLNQRFIIPYIYRGRNVGFTSRLCFNDTDKYIPKYYQVVPQDFVYNLDNQQDWTRKYVIVNEGVLDAWTVDGVSTLGEINQTRIDIINRLQKEIIVCPDQDKNGDALVEAAIENEWAVSFPKWMTEFKDAAAASEKYGRLLTTYSVISSAVEGKDKIYINWRISRNERERSRKRTT